MSNKPLSVRVLGIKELQQSAFKVAERLQNVIMSELIAGALEVETEAKRSISTVSSGSKNQVRYSPKRTAKVSPPGGPPNTDQGNLVRSISYEIDRNNYRVFVGTSLEYGKILETRKKRPWLKPALTKNERNIKNNMIKAIRAALKKGTK